MALSLSERQQAFLFVAILIPAIASLYATAQLLQPAPVRATQVHFVRLVIDSDGWSIRYGPTNTTNNTAFGILVEAAATLGFSVVSVPYEIPQGIFVTAINGTVNGDGGRYWLYSVNGVYPNVAADRFALHDDDAVRWSFGLSQEGM